MTGRMYRSNVRLAWSFFVSALLGSECVFVFRDPREYSSRMLPIMELHIWEKRMSDFTRNLAVTEDRRRAMQTPLKTVK